MIILRADGNEVEIVGYKRPLIQYKIKGHDKVLQGTMHSFKASKGNNEIVDAIAKIK